MSVQELISALQSPQMPERQVACALIAQQQLPEASSALADALCREWEDLNHPPLGEALVKYASEEQIITLAAERLQADDKILLTKFNGRTLPD
ncbi:MAG TPA: hypothetical protein VJ810_28395 [Blastocatellia bacterium]|nr:hypothetical protein [Blastocatellia bacterium]